MFDWRKPTPMSSGLEAAHAANLDALLAGAPTFRWREHPDMEPVTEAWLVTYWSTMLNPLPEPEAKAVFQTCVRKRELIGA